jgi:hypothetical protein
MSSSLVLPFSPAGRKVPYRCVGFFGTPGGYKCIQQPHRVIESHLRFGLAEEGLVPISAGNRWHVVIFTCSFLWVVASLVYLSAKGAQRRVGF